MLENAADGVARGNLNRLLVKIREERGLDLGQYRVRYVARRVAVRMNILGIHTYRQYAIFLDEHPDEYEKLVDALTINVTQFFRDPSVFIMFRNRVVPDLIAAKSARGQYVLRAWCAGCATGEEPYSVAMTMLDCIERANMKGALLTVIGTDLDPDALAFAKRGEYPLKQLGQIPAVDRTRYVDVDHEHFRLKADVMRVVRYQPLNLFEPTPIHGVDVVFCRNVFIYFNREQQERLIMSFWEALAPGGYLVLGRSERLAPALANKFELVSSRERIYRKVRVSQQ